MRLTQLTIWSLALSTLIVGVTLTHGQHNSVARPVLGFDASKDPAPPSTLPTVFADVKPKVDANPPVQNVGEILNGSTQPWWGRVSLRTDVGDGVGYKRGFTYLEGMFPILEADKSLLFADVRAVNFNNEARWEFNVGAAYRWYSPRCDSILGINSFYDTRKTNYHNYHQIGVGFEALTPTLEFRINGYCIVGAAHWVIADTGFVQQGIVNNNIIFQRVQTVETAMGGVDTEFGGRIPFFQSFAPKVFAGFYTYSSENTRTAVGVRGRFEAQVTNRLTLHGQVQNDGHFGTTLSGGVALYFGPASGRSGPGGRPTWDDVLRQRVQRDVNIVITTTTTTTGATQALPPPPPAPPPPPPIEEEEG